MVILHVYKNTWVHCTVIMRLTSMKIHSHFWCSEFATSSDESNTKLKCNKFSWVKHTLAAVTNRSDLLCYNYKACENFKKKYSYLQSLRNITLLWKRIFRTVWRVLILHTYFKKKVLLLLCFLLNESMFTFIITSAFIISSFLV